LSFRDCDALARKLLPLDLDQIGQQQIGHAFINRREVGMSGE
jgi:hypothetical protein